jgi:hypothetical protein
LEWKCFATNAVLNYQMGQNFVEHVVILSQKQPQRLHQRLHLLALAAHQCPTIK